MGKLIGKTCAKEGKIRESPGLAFRILPLSGDFLWERNEKKPTARVRARFIPISKSAISVFMSEKASDPRPRVTRPAPAGHTTCARGSRDPRPRVAGYVPKKNGNKPLRNGKVR